MMLAYFSTGIIPALIRLMGRSNTKMCGAPPNNGMHPTHTSEAFNLNLSGGRMMPGVGRRQRRSGRGHDA